jgi:putative phosphonate metabolism protein
LRYALYFSPDADHPLTKTASRWLGRDAFTGEAFPTPDVDGLSTEEVHTLTADPRRYAFHATLKAPFELADGKTEAELIEAFEQFAATTEAFDIPNVVVGQLGRFFALVPDRVYPELQDYAARIVEDFEPFRAPLSDADIARRKPETLSPQHRENLMRWGYPHVMDEFRFHMTLSGQVPPERAPAMRAALEPRFAAFTNRPLCIDGIALFVEPDRGADFIAHRWLPLKPAQETRKTAS